ncbi:MAG: sodium:proton exchanger, partial [Acidobacteria bacterium]
GLATAVACGYLTNRAGLSPIVGYLFAGILVGPHTPGFVADQHLAEQLAEIGVILLMFGVGLQFHLNELLAVRRIAVPGAVAQSAVATALGIGVGQLAGWPFTTGVVFGVALSVASTVVLARVLSDNRALHTPAGHIAIGWLVVEDLFTVIVLVLMPVAFGGRAGGGFVGPLAGALVKIGLAVGFTIVAGGRIIPWLLNRVAATRSRELFTLTVLSVALGIAVGSAMLFGVSMALGAFLAGLVVARSDFSVRAASEALPMRDAFAVLFFVSVGMLLDPWAVSRAPGLFAMTLGIILFGKPAAALAITSLSGYPLRVGLPVAVALSQIGEFSFIVANLATTLGVMTAEATNTVIAAAIASITLNPLLYRAIDPFLARVSRRSGAKAVGQLADRAAGAAPPSLAESGEDATVNRPTAVVVGAGPIGRNVARLLRENGVEPAVIELNMDTVRELRGQGYDAVYGDAGRTETLVRAGVASAQALVISVAGMPGVEETIRIARELNPGIQILVRTVYLREGSRLRRAGADAVI